MNIIRQIMCSTIVRVCTFNLRREGMDRGTVNDWGNRRPIMKKCLENMQPMIIGTQEGILSQLNNILDDLNESSKCWSWVGDEADELKAINAIFYRHDILSLIATGTFWFNDFRTKSGPAWGAKHSCACTWAHLEYLHNKQQPYIIYNVHLDYPSQNARHHSIPVLISEIQKNYNLNQVIITGDFNNWPEEVEGTTPVEELIRLGQKASEIEQMKHAGFIDTYQHGETPTFNGYRSAGYGPKIDFIWITSSSIYQIQGETKVDDYHDKNGFFPSDHFPVYADLICTL